MVSQRLELLAKQACQLWDEETLASQQAACLQLQSRQRTGMARLARLREQAERRGGEALGAAEQRQMLDELAQANASSVDTLLACLRAEHHLPRF